MNEMTAEQHKSPLNTYRSEISDLCYQASQERTRLYRLTVPTGAGKTLSSLRFSLYHAKQYEKRHIFYVAPFHTILEENADAIRKAVGSENYILEHHCNVILEDEEKEQVYKKLTENWDDPVIITTAVQMLNTLFSGQKSSIRRMYNLCNSIIIFDEVQAIPIQCTELFCLAVNFLTEFCNTTVILCSATQPYISERRDNNVFRCREMAGDISRYLDAFRRVEIEDKRDVIPGGMSIDQAEEFTRKAFAEYGSVLVVVNTKAAAKGLYEALARTCQGEYELYHLSNNMCPENRNDELCAMRKALRDGKKLICVSTQLIEAGVNISFGCVVRSLAGLDSIIQTAGRCNRHKEKERPGKVYIIQLSKEAEKLDRLYEIKRAREACSRFLDEFRMEPDRYNGDISSQKAVKRYYDLLYAGLEGEETKYPVVLDNGVKTNLIELLGTNSLGKAQYCRCHSGEMPGFPLNQAFRTAGEKFEAIPDDGRLPVVVPYNTEAEAFIEALGQSKTVSGQKSIFRKLQRFTVEISPSMKDKLKNALWTVGKAGILVLNGDYYDRKTGISETPKRIFLNF